MINVFKLQDPKYFREYFNEEEYDFYDKDKKMWDQDRIFEIPPKESFTCFSRKGGKKKVDFVCRFNKTANLRLRMLQKLKKGYEDVKNNSNIGFGFIFFDRVEDLEKFIKWFNNCKGSLTKEIELKMKQPA